MSAGADRAGADRAGGGARRPVVLALLTTYLPGYRSGGPLRTLANMVEHLGERFAFRVVTRDRDMGAAQPYEGVARGVWVGVGRASVLYLAVSLATAYRVVRAIRRTPHDVLYVNSFFAPLFSIVPLLARRFGLIPRRPVIVATRGEMAPSALGQKERKKQLFIALSRFLGLHRDVWWQVSSPYEQADLIRRLGVDEGRVLVAPNAPSGLGSTEDVRVPPHDPLRAVFVARIAPMKNLPFALDVLAKVDRDVVFDVYGTVEDRAYFEACLRALEGMRGRVRAAYHGPLPHDDVARVLAEHHLLFFPTQGENYGHVIAEALAVGTPVLISDRTPWRDLEAQGAGWDLPLEDPRRFVEVIEAYADTREEERARLRASTLRYAAARMQDPEVLRQNVVMFETALGQARGPG